MEALSAKWVLSQKALFCRRRRRRLVGWLLGKQEIGKGDTKALIVACLGRFSLLRWSRFLLYLIYSHLTDLTKTFPFHLEHLNIGNKAC